MINGYRARTVEALKTPARQEGKIASRSRTVLACCFAILSLLNTGCSKKTYDQGAATTKTSNTDSAADKYIELDLGKGVTMKLVLIPAGKFMMASLHNENTRLADFDEMTISRPFYMGVYEVTQAQWRVVMGNRPWNGNGWTKNGDDNAVSYVSWHDAIKFCEMLSKKPNKHVELPTEAQWEYACRAGSKTAYCFGDDASKLGGYAWYYDNAWDKYQMYAHMAGKKKANAWGLYDMHGNVEEWCRDFCLYRLGANPLVANEKYTSKYKYRPVRGGSFFARASACGSASRHGEPAGYQSSEIGFRVVVATGSDVK